MTDAPEWFWRRYNSLGSRSRERDTDLTAEFEQAGESWHASRMSCVDHGHVRILDVRDRGGLVMRGAVDDDALIAVFIWGDHVEVNGDRNDAPRLIVLGAGTELRTKQPGEYRYLRIGLRGPAFHAMQEGKRLKRWTAAGLHAPRCAPGAELRLQERLVRASMLAEAAARRGLDFRRAMAVAASEARAELLRVLAGAGGDEPPRPRVSLRRDLVREAIALLEATPDEPVSVSSVCTRLDVSERALQRAFRDWVGISLRAYERERRLRGAHGAILSEGDRRSITDIAMSFGFWHLGRFAAAYAALHGCPPTETRRRVWGTAMDEGGGTVQDAASAA